MEKQEIGNEMSKKKGRRVLLFPLPYQGHLNPMLQLANILHSTGFTITIIHTQFNSPNYSNYPHFTYYSLLNDSPENETGKGELHRVIDLINECNTTLVGPFRDCLNQLVEGESKEPIGCLITDAHWHFTQTIANSFNIRRIVFRTNNLSHVPIYVAHPVFRHKGYFSHQDEYVSSDVPVPEFPQLKIKDIPMIFTKEADYICQALDNMFNSMKLSSATIWNSFVELEQSVLEELHQIFPLPTFIIGPFHKYFPSSNTSLLEQDKSCIPWLDTQLPESVLYVSFGSLMAMEESDFIEMAWGLYNSMQPFLWVVRPGIVRGSEWLESLPNEFITGLDGRGCIVKWAPQHEVLAHPSTGAFWTHNGWNSTLESISEGVPMICSPFGADQVVNSRYVSGVWKVGVQLENGLVRAEIEKAIRRLLVEEEGRELREKIMELKQKVEVCLKPGGSSYKSLESFVDYILLP